ncbi:MAG: hypothetical protein QF486_00405 [Candidatus Woesearchaeota archaeon]|jgi:hypothetical protein|nr:hypothetical protein [Candidatus Woesearchaeota archaeon]MDP7181316.1 hypothetical protein [Candidatus Woesearchaeota archaeon]MDP7198065.1 hypothetical protein [Candidatus Woesearchaeota archaeon]MDP7466899.1 hypothetical protein [Candidatus Woesearchaeota archaeon]MDP7647334.1 hypothetical protein [Candidatus Woesearchaeota archaeon]|tara:strand:- start:1463 stop:1690 length:228 start_codon:yes stop_codon:yes gene_type:complete
MAKKLRKRVLTEHEEFKVMGMVLDKFLWIGAAFMGWGLYVSISSNFNDAIQFLVAGTAILAIFSWIVLKEFEHLR